MIGYHYTASHLYEDSIKTQGLHPYKIKKPEFDRIFGKSEITGIWIWESEPKNLSEIGIILFQMASKGKSKVVKLRVKYNKKSRLCNSENYPIRLCHSGYIGEFEYHSHEKAYIVKEPIPAKNIKLIRTFDLKDAWGLDND